MAVRTSNRMRTGSPVVTAFEFDDSILSTDILKIVIFKDYTTDWADFILMNRKNLSEEPVHQYDIVVGPIADDTDGVQIRRYIIGYISIEIKVQR